MVFKLVRTDTEEPCKIELPLGTHLLGRGKFLDCEDKRVSRNHGELIVTDDSVTIKALHQNPCFFKTKGTEDTQILKLHCTVDLCNGDKFGLLPDSYWYEVLHSTQFDIRAQSPELRKEDINNRRKNQIRDDDRIENHSKEEHNSGRDQQIGDGDRLGNIEKGDENITDSDKTAVSGFEDDFDDDDKPLNIDLNESVQNSANGSQSLIDRAESSSLMQRAESPSLTQQDDLNLPLLIAPENQSATQDYQVDQPEAPNTPSKRSHCPDEAVDVKRVKTEPLDVKKEPDEVKPGPSNNQADSLSDAGTAGQDGQAGAAAKPCGPGRERCIYGANCYRKNPVHKAQFSHPADADWGTGERGACPWGSGCRRRDPRHWSLHHHPPGVQPPVGGAAPQPGMQVVQRHGNIFYINAHSVNFYDDHFQVEDSDGDSVDFDYEF